MLLVGLAIPIVALAHRLNAPPLVGFLLAGVVVGSHGLGLIDSPEEISTLSELGAALLLFAVGLELSLSHLHQWARSVFLGGGFQVADTLGTVTGVVLTTGIPMHQVLSYGALAAIGVETFQLKPWAAPERQIVLSVT